MLLRRSLRTPEMSVARMMTRNRSLAPDARTLVAVAALLVTVIIAASIVLLRERRMGALDTARTGVQTV
jgi:hypothetical protein